VERQLRLCLEVCHQTGRSACPCTKKCIFTGVVLSQVAVWCGGPRAVPWSLRMAGTARRAVHARIIEYPGRPTIVWWGAVGGKAPPGNGAVVRCALPWQAV